MSTVPVDLKSFYHTTFDAWKNGLCLEFNSESQNIAKNNAFEEFIEFLNELTGNALENIDNTTGFIPGEFLLFARSSKLIVINKRYFLSTEKNISKQFDSYLLNKIKSATRTNISYMTIKLFNGIKLRYYYSGDWITKEGIDKALKILPETNNQDFLEGFERYNKIESDKESKRKIVKFSKERILRALTYTFIFTGILFAANIVFNHVPASKSFVQVLVIIPFTFLASLLLSLFTTKSE